jgi:ferritin-like metal-binding protein YciE
MPLKNPKELFVLLLSDARQNAERTNKALQEVSQIAQDPEVKEALEESDFVTEQVIAKLDQCFKLIGEKPIKLTGRLHDIMIEDIRREAADIQSPVARQLYVLSKAAQMIQLRVGEYVVLIAAAGITGNHLVGELLESCLADKRAAVERARLLIRNIVETRIRERSAA